MAVVKAAIQKADHDPGLDPIPEARAAVEAKVIAEVKRKKAGVPVKMTKAEAAAEVWRNPEVKAKRSQRMWFKMTMMTKQRAEVPARKRVRVKAGVGVVVRRRQQRRRRRGGE